MTRISDFFDPPPTKESSFSCYQNEGLSTTTKKAGWRIADRSVRNKFGVWLITNLVSRGWCDSVCTSHPDSFVSMDVDDFFVSFLFSTFRSRRKTNKTMVWGSEIIVITNENEEERQKKYHRTSKNKLTNLFELWRHCTAWTRYGPAGCLSYWAPIELTKRFCY